MQTITPIRALKDNYIWMLPDENAKSVWIVDPGEAPPVIEVLTAKGLTLSGILLTHHHGDHSGGIPGLLQYAGKLPVVGSYKSSVNYINHGVKEGDELLCGSHRIRVIEIPGHTLDHLAYYDGLSLFCGDTLFSAGCGKVFEGTLAMMYESINKILQCDESLKIYCGHEYTLANLHFAQAVEQNNSNVANKIKSVKDIILQGGCTLPSVLREEKLFNPFLRCQVPEVIQAVEERAGKKMQNAIEVFGFLRAWKNDFTH